LNNRLKKTRLSGKRDFDPVFKGRKFVSGDLVFYHSSSGLNVGRIGIVVGKKSIPAAVSRNRFRRRVRALFWQNMDVLNGLDIVVIARRGKRLENFEALNRCFEKFKGSLGGLSFPARK
jgi:ribonuclease P protein component